MKLLVIEDNPRLAERIKHLLRKDYVVDLATTGEDGLHLALTITYNGIILDLKLPDISGLKVCKSLRSHEVATPILVLTANTSTQSVVRLLDSGADDYLTKPFNKEELKARVTALVRRQQLQYLKEKVVFGDLEIDLNRREVHRAGKLIELRRKEFDILEYLIHNHGRTVSREMIIDHVWENATDRWSTIVDVHIKRLRDKIDRPFPHHLIKTAHGIGYMVENTPGLIKEERLL